METVILVPISWGYDRFNWIMSWKGPTQTLAVGRAKHMLTILSLFLSQTAQDASGQQEWGGLQKAVLSWQGTWFKHHPSPFCVQASAHTGMGTGIFFATVLVFGAATLAAYSYFRLSRRAAGFQHFEVRETWEHGGGGDPLWSPAPDWLLHRAHPGVGGPEARSPWRIQETSAYSDWWGLQG